MRAVDKGDVPNLHCGVVGAVSVASLLFRELVCFVQ